ncbi:histidine kinase [Solirubrobacter ginsenosidimutans]|uniref:histidine kinase n=1 Tax=Solirubrobacter ginsenosidimutans TaxID=490573 RepID=A0A9X3MPR6_9ACTN|nr:histidine kinase [Solirubrobacter ginsenosidimutans]MDA0159551.1 histidine kinase [Solirubrobacter ginsenosidimutans]
MLRRSDVLVAALAAALSVILLIAELPNGSDVEPHGADLLGGVLVVLTCAAIPFRRRYPFPAALVALVPSGIGLGMGYAMLIPLIAALLMSSYGAIHSGRGRTVVLAVLGGNMIGAAAANLEGTGVTLRAIGGFAFGALPAVIGDAIRTERARTREAREHLLRIEELRDRDVERAVAEERLRIARDMHDITGHHLSAISLQAAGAGRTTTDPAARVHFERIHALTVEALGQTRRALGVLRESEPATRAPTPRLEHVEQLLTPARDAGLAVELRREGEERPLSDEIEVCAYRVVQESLTNVVRHAAAAVVRVQLEYGDEELRIAVVDDGVGAQGRGAGGGIEGMRERVAIVGGNFDAGPAQPRGWSVRARLPLGAAA